jgi:NAD+ synthase (glutamine-hydrolysing)
LKKYFIKTYGCQMNEHDSRKMEASLLQDGYEKSRSAADADLIVGFVEEAAGHRFHNATAYLSRGKVIHLHRKLYLPTYGMFDEGRDFAPGDVIRAFKTSHGPAGMLICEDAWHSGAPFDSYARLGASVVVNINGSPYHLRKQAERLEICRERAMQTGAWIVYVNMVGGQDELVFDGGSMVVAPDGELVWHASMFEEELLVVDLDVPETDDAYPGSGTPKMPKRGIANPVDTQWDWPAGPAEVYGALRTGLRDYVTKNGFAEVIIGLSGGIDSALVATLAADALGTAPLSLRRVHGHRHKRSQSAHHPKASRPRRL